ncbi:MAG: hypothetical protein HOM07_09790, partial [Rhodospirillaceae bacterium]|nr:hypothetical protein [Rhodospirillaceae bacterium]
MSQQSQSLDDQDGAAPRGMTVAQARRAEFSIIGLCLLALVLIFQPYSVTL